MIAPKGQSGVSLLLILIILLIIAILLLIGECISRSPLGSPKVTGLAVVGPSTIPPGGTGIFTVILMVDRPTLLATTYKINIVEADPLNDDELITDLEITVGRNQYLAMEPFTLTCKERTPDGKSIIEGKHGESDKEDIHEIQAEARVDSSDHNLVCTGGE